MIISTDRGDRGGLVYPFTPLPGCPIPFGALRVRYGGCLTHATATPPSTPSLSHPSTSDTDDSPFHLTPPQGDREILRAILISNLAWTEEVILALHHHNMVEATRWSDPLPSLTPGLVMRIVTCQRKKTRRR